MIKVRVSATSANLGAAFDLAGISLTLYNEYTFEVIDSGLEFFNVDEFSNEDNLVYQAFLKTAKLNGREVPGLRIGIKASIPVARGLGSSASLIVAGIVAADFILKLNLSREAMLDIATSIEGHPDNVAPAIFGGLCLSFKGETINIKLDNDLKYYVVVPDYRLKTEESRKLVKQDFKLNEVINQMASVSFMIEGLRTANLKLLKHANNDLIHEKGRSKIVPILNELKEEYKDSYVVLSGAGSSVLIISDKKLTFDEKYKVLDLKIDNEGYKVY